MNAVAPRRGGGYYHNAIMTPSFCDDLEWLWYDSKKIFGNFENDSKQNENGFETKTDNFETYVDRKQNVDRKIYVDRKRMHIERHM